MPRRIHDSDRVCFICGDRSSSEYYHSRKDSINILCRRHYQNEYYELSYNTTRKAKALEYYSRHKSEQSNRAKLYRDKHKDDIKRKQQLWYVLNKGNIRKDRLFQRLMLIDLLSYGRFSCGYCAYDSDFRALEIDHKNSDGGKDRSRFKNQTEMILYYLSNIDEAFERLQILCSNCNRIKRHEMYEWGDVDRFISERRNVLCIK